MQRALGARRLIDLWCPRCGMLALAEVQDDNNLKPFEWHTPEGV